MAQPWRKPAPAVTPTTITECARHYMACATALAKAMGLPLSEAFVQAHRESISCVFIESGRAGVRLAADVTLPSLSEAPVRTPEHPTRTDTEEPSGNGQQDITHVPTGLKLPCGGQLIADLTASQLYMLIQKVSRLAMADMEAHEPLLSALQFERSQRINSGKRNGYGSE